MSSNWSENQNKMKERKEEDRMRREKLSGFFFNLAQLTFAAAVLGSFSPLFSGGVEKPKLLEMLVGAVTTMFFAILGYLIIKQRKI